METPKHLKSSHTKQRLRNLAFVAVAIIAVAILIPQRQALADSLAALRHAAIGPVVWSAVFTLATYALAAGIYLLLARHPINWREMALVQTATALTSRLAPIGIGTMGLTAYFLHKRQHTTAEAVAVVTANNGIGIIGHILLLGLILIQADLPPNLTVHINTVIPYVLFAIAAAIAIIAYAAPRLRHRIVQAVLSLGRAFASYRRQPRRLAYALGVSLILSLVYVAAMGFCCQALGINVSLSTIFLVYTFSLLAGVITPTPGGLLGVEAGIVGGFVAYGIDTSSALSVALLYRFISYWLPLVPGFFALRLVQRRLF
jgi:undecaprenyl-diphosphatase